MKTGGVLNAMLGRATTGVIPVELIPVDRILQRWDVSVGTGLPSESWDDNPKAKPPPLDDDTAIVVDQIVQHSPPKTRQVTIAWYRTPQPTRVIAGELGMSERSLETARNLALNYLKWRFEESNNLTLLRLLRVRV